jgi:CTD small phosphatase-like protein 2
MWSPRDKAAQAETPTPSSAAERKSGAHPSAASTPAGAAAASAAQTPTSPKPGAGTPSSGIFNSFSKMLWGQETEAADAAAADPNAFITSSPRRSPAPPGLGGGAAAAAAPATPLSVHVAGDGAPPAQTVMSPRTGSLLDSIFSPVFSTIFGQNGKPAPADGSAAPPAPPETRDATAHRAAAAAAAAEALARAKADADAAAAAAEEAEEEEAAAAASRREYAPDEFDPYAFIKSLPPLPSLESRPIALPRKRPGTPALSLVLDLDETLLHSSIVPVRALRSRVEPSAVPGAARLAAVGCRARSPVGWRPF